MYGGTGYGARRISWTQVESFALSKCGHSFQPELLQFQINLNQYVPTLRVFFGAVSRSYWKLSNVNYRVVRHQLRRKYYDESSMHRLSNLSGQYVLLLGGGQVLGTFGLTLGIFVRPIRAGPQHTHVFKSGFAC